MTINVLYDSRQLEANYISNLPTGIFDYIPLIEQLRLAKNPWYCDCASSYLATWLQKRYFSLSNVTEEPIPFDDPTVSWDYAGGAICQGPANLERKLLLQLTRHELCEGQWASMKGLAPRLPIDLLATIPPNLLV